MVARAVALGDRRRARRVVVLRDDSMVLFFVVHRLVPRDAERVFLFWFVCRRSMKGVLLFLFFDGVAGIEAEEAVGAVVSYSMPPAHVRTGIQVRSDVAVAATLSYWNDTHSVRAWHMRSDVVVGAVFSYSPWLHSVST